MPWRDALIIAIKSCADPVLVKKVMALVNKGYSFEEIADMAIAADREMERK